MALQHPGAVCIGRYADEEVMDPEVERMLRVQRDEPGAFSELIAHYWGRVFGRFYRQFGDRQEAEDLAQDVFMRLYRSRKRYRPRARFVTWLFHIARNVARNALRTRRRRRLTPVGLLAGGEDERPVIGLSASLDTPSRPIERAEMVGVVRTAVSALIDRQRAAVELQFLDCSYSEIAAELDMTPKAAKSLLYRARNQLRESLVHVADQFA